MICQKYLERFYTNQFTFYEKKRYYYTHAALERMTMPDACFQE